MMEKEGQLMMSIKASAVAVKRVPSTVRKAYEQSYITGG